MIVVLVLDFITKQENNVFVRNAGNGELLEYANMTCRLPIKLSLFVI
jgi:hypothetical protein